MQLSQETSRTLSSLASSLASEKASGSDWEQLEIELNTLSDGNMSIRAEATSRFGGRKYPIVPTSAIQEALVSLIGLRVSQSDEWTKLVLTVTGSVDGDPGSYRVNIG
jgi:hypothetical protein